MEKQTIWTKIRDFVWRDRISAVEYFFAKRWLDRNFSKQEYWGDYIAELEFNQRQIDLKYKQIQENSKDTLMPPITN